MEKLQLLLSCAGHEQRPESTATRNVIVMGAKGLLGLIYASLLGWQAGGWAAHAGYRGRILVLILAPQTLETAHVACLEIAHASCIVLPQDRHAHADQFHPDCSRSMRQVWHNRGAGHRGAMKAAGPADQRPAC